ncbi:MAG: hypothetical protein ACT4P7_23015 [Gemmatimonadaceae bacterium]
MQPVLGQAPGEGIARSNPEKAIELLQAQIAGVKKEIADLTGQLVPGTSDARESAVESQLEAATERLGSLQSQLDRVVSGDASFFTIEPPPPPPVENDIPRGVQNMLEMLLIAGVIVALGLPLVRMLARRLEPRSKTDAADASPRLERLEQAMDAVAIEVERISEGQRFTNKLLGDMRALPAPNPLEHWAGSKGKVEEGVKRG